MNQSSRIHPLQPYKNLLDQYSYGPQSGSEAYDPGAGDGNLLLESGGNVLLEEYPDSVLLLESHR